MSTQASSSGPGFLSLLTLIFVTLKLTGVDPVAGWSWWAVLSPMLIGLAVAGVIILIAVWAATSTK